MSSEVVIFILLLVIVALVCWIIPTIYRIKFLESSLKNYHQHFIEYVLLSDLHTEVDNAEEFQNDFNAKWNKVCESMKEFDSHV